MNPSAPTFSQPLPQDRAHVSRHPFTAKAVLMNLPGRFWIALDGVTALLIFFFVYEFYPKALIFQEASADHGLPANWQATLFALTFATCSHILGLHEPQLKRRTLRLASFLFFSLSLTLIAVTTANSVFFSFAIGHKLLLLVSAITWCAVLLQRTSYWALTEEHIKSVLLIGTESFVEKESQLIREASDERMRVTSLACPVELVGAPQLDEMNRSLSEAPETSKERHQLQPWLLRQSFDEIVTEFSLPKSAMSEVVACLDSGQPVFSYAQFTENHFRKVPVRRIDDCWFLRASLLGLLPHYRVSKRMIDICIAIAGIVCSLPLLLIAAIAIKMTSRGPVFYQQTRVGLHNIPFSIYKLRSMTTSAEHHGAQWAKKADARITPVGRILRKTRIDEIPQFWNILKGDMAFIGPRPERPEFTGDLANQIPFYEKRHLVKPGLTGWAQINYPYGASVEDAEKKLEYDLFYVKHGSLVLDFHILIRTIGAVMKGAR